MTHIIDEKMKEFIDKELSEIYQDKERVIKEKRRARAETKKLEMLQNYDNMLVRQYSLLCKRDIALFQMVAGIGEMSMEGENRVSQEIEDNDETLQQYLAAEFLRIYMSK